MENEATLREVLREVSLYDLVEMLKGAGIYFGCLGVVIIPTVLFLEGTADVLGFDSSFGIPTWLFWLVMTWLWVWSIGSHRSFHTIELSWFFPRVGVVTSLICAAYLFGAWKLVSNTPSLDEPPTVRLGYMALVFAYLLPVYGMVALLQVGHQRLVEKRREEAQQTTSPGYNRLRSSD